MDWRDRRHKLLEQAAFSGQRVSDYLLGTGDKGAFPAKATEEMRDRMTVLRARNAASAALTAMALDSAWCDGFNREVASCVR